MKNLVSLIIVLICCISLSFSQKAEKKIKVYKVWVTEMDGNKHEGFLYSADENGIDITANFSSTELSTSVEVSDIKKIKIRRKGSVGRGVLILGGTGALFGGGIGFLAGDDPENQWFRADAEDKARAGAVVGGVLGSGLGLIAGLAKKKMIINGNIYSYNAHLTKLKECSINSQNIE